VNKRIGVGLAAAKVFRFLFASTLLVLAGWTFYASGQTVTTLYQFGGIPSNGVIPVATLVQGSDGNFYGTTKFGGNATAVYSGGVGTVFRVSSTGNLTTLWDFGIGATDGQIPIAGLVQGSDGYFYGTTWISAATTGYGSVYRISPSGNLTTLHLFNGGTDGSEPYAALVEGTDGYFYGTTTAGGTNHQGTVFQISSTGTLTTVWQFGGFTTDGRKPYGALLQGNDGYFYGTTFAGGTSNSGTVFRVSSSGNETNLYSFGSHQNDGSQPYAGLTLGSDGYFYGTTYEGGTNNDGTIFRISPSGTYTTLYSFGSHQNDGSQPYAGLTLGSDGYFYGTATQGGFWGGGTAFRISSAGVLTTLWPFGDLYDLIQGDEPYGGLVQGSDGSFYGTTYAGGTNSVGNVYLLSVPLTPPANQISAIQLADTNIIFSIPSVAYETYQLQFSSSMTPTNWVNVPGVSVTNSIGALLTVTNFGGAIGPQGFYRFAITP
jgi:uncharacterized repeat protein (TIGR03803 family)